jgi:predicted nuclease of predicted toxin-antitoxin system
MKLLFDANLPPQLASRLQDVYAESKHVRSIGLNQFDDKAIWNAARREGYMIVSKDSDFYERSILEGFPPKILWLRVGNCSTARLENLLREQKETITNFGMDEHNSFLIIV